jgi:TRAP-type transport system small permease protein
LDKVKKFLNGIDLIIEYICSGILVFLVCLVFSQVFCRYVLKFTPSWSEETSVILMIWMGFIACAIGVKRGIHLTISALVNLFPRKIQKIIYYFDEIAVLIFGLIMIFYGGQLSSHTMMSIMPATQIRTGFLYMCIPVSGVMISFYCIARIMNLVLNREN